MAPNATLYNSNMMIFNTTPTHDNDLTTFHDNNNGYTTSMYCGRSSLSPTHMRYNKQQHRSSPFQPNKNTSMAFGSQNEHHPLGFVRRSPNQFSKTNPVHHHQGHQNNFKAQHVNRSIPSRSPPKRRTISETLPPHRNSVLSNIKYSTSITHLPKKTYATAYISHVKASATAYNTPTKPSVIVRESIPIKSDDRALTCAELEALESSNNILTKTPLTCAEFEALQQTTPTKCPDIRARSPSPSFSDVSTSTKIEQPPSPTSSVSSEILDIGVISSIFDENDVIGDVLEETISSILGGTTTKTTPEFTSVSHDGLDHVNDTLSLTFKQEQTTNDLLNNAHSFTDEPMQSSHIESLNSITSTQEQPSSTECFQSTLAQKEQPSKTESTCSVDNDQNRSFSNMKSCYIENKAASETSAEITPGKDTSTNITDIIADFVRKMQCPSLLPETKLEVNNIGFPLLDQIPAYTGDKKANPLIATPTSTASFFKLNSVKKSKNCTNNKKTPKDNHKSKAPAAVEIPAFVTAMPDISHSAPKSADLPLPPCNWLSGGSGKTSPIQRYNITNQIKVLVGGSEPSIPTPITVC